MVVDAKKVIIAALACLIAYCIGAFIAADWDIHNWPDILRFFVGLLFGLLPLIILTAPVD